MKSFLKCLIALVVMFMFNAVAVQGQNADVDEYIKKANNFRNSGALDQAVNTMKEAVEKYPKSADAYSYLGLYIGMQAGKTKDFMEAGRLVNESFGMLDKAVSLDPNNPIPRFHRGLMGVNIPEFLGKLDAGIKDLEAFIKIAKESPKKVSTGILISGYNFLAKGYQKKKEKEKAIGALKKIIERAPETDLARKAKKRIEELLKAEQAQAVEKKRPKPDSAKIERLKQQVKDEPNNTAHLMELARAYIDDKNFEEARTTLKKTIELDPTNINAYKLLISVLGELAGKGYDERIYENTDLRSNLAFEVSRLIDKACELAPGDIELRLVRGITGVEMPFFVKKLDQAIDDLNWILRSKTTDSTKADALYWLGRAYQKKSMSYWIKVVTDYSKTKASQDVFKDLRPGVKRLDLSKYQTPILTIDFVLGFQDELAPQCAVWIETKEETFVKTIYVSGFSGYAKEKQVNLPVWSKSSKFIDADAVTGASINIGHHIYVWDLKDHSGKEVKPGEYIIKVEVAYWPSMEYQSISAAIKLGKNPERVVTEKGNLIPYLEVKYYPSK